MGYAVSMNVLVAALELGTGSAYIGPLVGSLPSRPALRPQLADKDVGGTGGGKEGQVHGATGHLLGPQFLLSLGPPGCGVSAWRCALCV